jgi:hypothetical protein
MITLAHIVICVFAVLYLGVRIKLTLSGTHRRQLHEPRALKLLEAAKPAPTARQVNTFVGPQSLAGAIMGGLARMDGTCVRCGGYWNESHGDAPHGTWNRPVNLPIAGPGTRRRG